MKSLLTALFRAIARIAESESGELLSVRRKAHLLEAERYARLAEARKAPRRAEAPQALTFSRCRNVLRHARISHGKLAG
jgi:hypothetical protein